MQGNRRGMVFEVGPEILADRLKNIQIKKCFGQDVGIRLLIATPQSLLRYAQVLALVPCEVCFHLIGEGRHQYIVAVGKPAMCIGSTDP